MILQMKFPILLDHYKLYRHFNVSVSVSFTFALQRFQFYFVNQVLEQR